MQMITLVICSDCLSNSKKNIDKLYIEMEKKAHPIRDDREMESTYSHIFIRSLSLLFSLSIRNIDAKYMTNIVITRPINRFIFTSTEAKFSQTIDFFE